MVRLIRWLHLLTASSLAGFTLLYTLTGFMLIYSDRPPPPREEHAQVALPPGAASGPPPQASAQDALGRWQWGSDLARRLELRGRVSVRSAEGGGWQLEVVQPGVTRHVLVRPEAEVAEVLTKRRNAWSTVSSFHHVHERNGPAAFQAWSWALDLFSLALIGFAVTGAAMWFAMRRDRLGWILLGTATAFVAGSLVALF